MDLSKCDRCKQETDDYFIVDGTFWTRFAKGFEKIVCLKCMEKNESYRLAYDPNYPPYIE